FITQSASPKLYSPSLHDALPIYKPGRLALTIIIAEANTRAAMIIANTKRLTILLTSMLFFSQFKISKLILVRPLAIVSKPFLREIGRAHVSEATRNAFQPTFSSVMRLSDEKP